MTLPDALLQSLQQQLEPVRFSPAYFHLQGGIAFSFQRSLVSACSSRVW